MFFNNNFYNICIDDNGSSSFFNNGIYGFYNLRRTSNRKTSTTKIMTSHRGMHGKTTLLRRQTIIAVLSAKYFDQFLIVCQRFQDFVCGSV